jgi:hypothetical protein
MLDSPNQRQNSPEMATQTRQRSAIVADDPVTTCGG